MGQSLAADLMHHPRRRRYRHARTASIHSPLGTPVSSIMYEYSLTYTVLTHASHEA